MSFCETKFIIFIRAYGGEIQTSCISYSFTKFFHACACIAELSVMLLDTYAGSNIACSIAACDAYPINWNP